MSPIKLQYSIESVCFIAYTGCDNKDIPE